MLYPAQTPMEMYFFMKPFFPPEKVYESPLIRSPAIYRCAQRPADDAKWQRAQKRDRA